MNEFTIGVIVITVVILLYMALRIYLKLNVFRSNNGKIGIIADELMNNYLAEGLDKKYKSYSN